MLIQLSTYTVVTVVDSICVQNFYYETVAVGKNVINFKLNVRFSVHIDNKKKDFLILGLGPTIF